MAVYTLAQWAQLGKQTLPKDVMLGIAMQGMAADILNWRDLGGRLSETGVRFDEVISPDWIPLGGTISSKTANAKPLSYGTYQMAVHFDIPRILDKANTDQLVRASKQQLNLIEKGAAYVLNDTFINGDQASDNNQFDGLNKLVASMDSGQTVTGDGSFIYLTASYTDAAAARLWSALDNAGRLLEGGEPTAAFANKQTLQKIESFARQNKLYGDHFDWRKNPYEVSDPRTTERTKSTKPAFTYRGVPYYDLGKKADQSTQVMLNTYTEGGLTSQGSRILFVKTGEQDVEGLQFENLEIIPVTGETGTLEATDVRRWRVSWVVGLAVWGPRSVVKLQGLRIA